MTELDRNTLFLFVPLKPVNHYIHMIFEDIIINTNSQRHNIFKGKSVQYNITEQDQIK